MLILGIDTSCDDTSLAVMRYDKKERRFEILSNIISSQIKAHVEYGGIVPEIASREHLKNITAVYRMALEKASVNAADIDLIAVTAGPGLTGSLIVGYTFAKGLALANKKPFITVDHIKAHTAANFMEPYNIGYPAVALTISGGHSSLSVLESPIESKFIGGTIDDAVGELFDKVARYLNLPYPGGPVLDRMSKDGELKYKLPKPLINEDNYNFSFSGLKTAVITFTKQNKDFELPHLAYSMTRSICDVFVKKIDKAAREFHAKTILLSGGVACNSMIREAVRELGAKRKVEVVMPPPILCTDNGVMIAILGTLNYLYSENKNTKNSDVYPTTRW
ncbi:MAG: O-sialoglycoprotein endopeptidase [uncultured bacterium]|uniref:tRNA N6-adenosine threonylcarbamoyltransferase n=1 Tax=Candidatus Wallbacteria bacterium GWC2_49_35 TaxID=1817813 RepID=A0A1F7WGK6_9BACT|nr:MAG: O-sialoglycoprotein endopeptidase [uncultured bacterium]OGM01175.1 MAG: tRNA (adenosine(37)-N6)-threonylcarbamoyltransferase complex transferase subunit TsaD [Candidatus Wallbacteria bacterium GWC2_49_35]